MLVSCRPALTRRFPLSHEAVCNVAEAKWLQMLYILMSCADLAWCIVVAVVVLCLVGES